jgi:hypothetical protein
VTQSLSFLNRHQLTDGLRLGHRRLRLLYNRQWRDLLGSML